MNEEQHRQMKRLLRECCNYDGGQCLILDRGDGCVCVQRISYSLICRWFREGVLPLDRELEAALLQQLDRKRCIVCGRYLFKNSNNTKYCSGCSRVMARTKASARKRKQRENVTLLGFKTPYKSRASKRDFDAAECFFMDGRKRIQKRDIPPAIRGC